MVLVLIFISTRFIKYIQLAVDGTISSSAVFSMLGLQIPAIAGFLLPLSFFIAVLLTLGRLYSENEMAVIRSVGVGEVQIAKNILPLSLGLALISGVISFWVNPWSSFQSKSLLAQEKAEAKFGVFSPGRFQENSAKTGVVFVESKDDQGVIQGIFAVSGLGDEEGDLQIQTATSGNMQQNQSGNDDQGGDYLVLEKGINYIFNQQQNRWNITEYDSYFMRVQPAESESLSLKNKSIATAKLLQNPQAAEWAELHWRLSAPLSMPILCFLAVPLAYTRPRKGKFSKLFPAIMVYLVYALLMMNGRRFIETGKIPVELGFWWIHALVVGFCLWLYRPGRDRPRRSRRKQSV